jgi:hypothetical protein
LAATAVLRAPTPMTASARPIALLTLLAALLLSAAAPPRAAAHGRFFVGIGPVYPYPY